RRDKICVDQSPRGGFSPGESAGGSVLLLRSARDRLHRRSSGRSKLPHLVWSLPGHVELHPLPRWQGVGRGEETGRNIRGLKPAYGSVGKESGRAERPLLVMPEHRASE